MLNMKEKASMGLCVPLVVALTASLVLASRTYEVQLVASPGGQLIDAPAGEPFNISCQGIGDDESKFASMKWLNSDGNVIPEGNPGVVKTKNNVLFLTFTNPKIEDSGTYKCTAVYDNEHNLQYDFSIDFYGNDTSNETALFRDARAVNISASNVQFITDVSGPVRYIEVKYSESRDATEYRTRLVRTSKDFYSIKNLVPSGLYSFQFKTVPSEDDNWSRVYNVTLLPDVPEIILRSLEKDSITLQYFRKTDDIMRETIDSYEIKYYSVRMEQGNSWIPSTCAITIQLPSCSGSSYTIAGLSQNVFYQLEVRTHTASGYGEPASQKIFLPQ